jgi:HEPN domain-containing protein
MQETTKGWVRKAEKDLLAAKDLAAAAQPFHDHVCNNCQQSAEKYIKAFLQEFSISFRRTHDLEELLGLAIPIDKTLRGLRRGLKFLTDFAVDYRYPGENATSRQSKAALRWAERVRKEIRRRLKLRY